MVAGKRAIRPQSGWQRSANAWSRSAKRFSQKYRSTKSVSPQCKLSTWNNSIGLTRRRAVRPRRARPAAATLRLGHDHACSPDIAYTLSPQAKREASEAVARAELLSSELKVVCDTLRLSRRAAFLCYPVDTWSTTCCSGHRPVSCWQSPQDTPHPVCQGEMHLVHNTR